MKSANSLILLLSTLVLMMVPPAALAELSGHMRVGISITRSAPCTVELKLPEAPESLPARAASYPASVDSYCPDNVPPVVSSYYDQDNANGHWLMIQMLY